MKPNAAPTVSILSLTNSGTGYSWTIPAACRAFSVQARTAVDVLMGTAQADVQAGGTNYITIKSGTVFNSPQDFASLGSTLWFSAGSNTITLEILTWA